MLVPHEILIINLWLVWWYDNHCVVKTKFVGGISVTEADSLELNHLAALIRLVPCSETYSYGGETETSINQAIPAFLKWSYILLAAKSGKSSMEFAHIFLFLDNDTTSIIALLKRTGWTHLWSPVMDWKSFSNQSLLLNFYMWKVLTFLSMITITNNSHNHCRQHWYCYQHYFC